MDTYQIRMLPQDTATMNTYIQYQQSLARSTGPDVITEFPDERPGASAAINTMDERQACEEWLRAVEFPDDAELWEHIKRKWIGFLSATSRKPDPTLAPEGKVAQYYGLLDYAADDSRWRFRNDRRLRRNVRRAVMGLTETGSLPSMETMAERLPARARIVLNEQDALRRGTVFQTTAPVWEGGRRLRYMSMWTNMVSFLLYCYDDGSLDYLGLELDDNQWGDMMGVQGMAQKLRLRSRHDDQSRQLAQIWAATETVMIESMRRPRSTARNNPLLWWMAFHVKSAITPGPDDYITRGRFQDSPMPMDLDLRERAVALLHYAKIEALHQAMGARPADAWLAEVEADLAKADMSWTSVEGGRRPAPHQDRRRCSSEAWKAMLDAVRTEIYDVFAEGMAIGQISDLEAALAASGRQVV